jgi:hypothetical protein
VFHLGVIYLVWGSTYLGIRLAILGGFPPFVLGALRVFVAGGLLLVWAALRGAQVRVSWGEARILAISGLLFWIGANGLVMWNSGRLRDMPPCWPRSRRSGRSFSRALSTAALLLD